ncbi:MAG: DUF3426 domain-containing protein [Sideroxydans sp.]|nr:DUF3426 domain-containing protein [Sideroxydans sp.]
MSDITLCPQCATRFKVSDEQLNAHEGLVRCGRCHNVFNAREYLQEDEPSPQLSLLIDDEPANTVEDTEDAAIKQDFAEALTISDGNTIPGQEDSSVTDTDHVRAAGSLTEDDFGRPDFNPIPDLTELEDAPTTLAQQVQFVDDPLEGDMPAPPKTKHWLATIIAATLFVLLTAQVAYFFRDTLAVKLPGLKPLLVEYCGLLHCTVELPREAEWLSIESSELEADAKLVNVITLHALLHNRAGYSQAWPSLELTLTDSHDKVIARRSFHPADYLSNKDDLPRGIGHNREQEIAIRLDTSDLRPSGYRLLLYYPQQVE